MNRLLQIYRKVIYFTDHSLIFLLEPRTALLLPASHVFLCFDFDLLALLGQLGPIGLFLFLLFGAELFLELPFVYFDEHHIPMYKGDSDHDDEDACIHEKVIDYGEVDFASFQMPDDLAHQPRPSCESVHGLGRFSFVGLLVDLSQQVSCLQYVQLADWVVGQFFQGGQVRLLLVGDELAD
jgi:hypothetical protein